jgi:hypothetical protein
MQLVTAPTLDLNDFPEHRRAHNRAMTYARASATGAVTRAWFGFLIGLLVGLFTFGPAWLGLIFGGVLIGALWGAVFGYLANRTGSGQHDYASLRTLGPGRYELMVADGYADHAKQPLHLS